MAQVVEQMQETCLRCDCKTLHQRHRRTTPHIEHLVGMLVLFFVGGASMGSTSSFSSVAGATMATFGLVLWVWHGVKISHTKQEPFRCSDCGEPWSD